MGNLDKFRYQQVPDIESGHDTDETASGVPREEQVKREVIVGPKEKVKLYLKSHHQKQFFSSIIDQENAGFKQLLLELEGVDWNFLHSIDRSIDLKEICIEILQDFTKSKLQPETVHVIISPRGIDLEPITNLNDLFPIPNPVPVLSKIQCTVLEQSKKTFHVLAKVFKCGSAECRDKSIIYMVQNTFHDITNKCDENFSQDWHEISLFKRSTNTGNLLGITHQHELHNVDMYCFACGYDLQEQVLDRLTIAKHEFKVLLANSKVPVSVVFHTNQDLELQVGDRKCLLVKPRAKYDHQKTAILAPVVTGIFVFEPEIALLECGSDDDALIARLSSLPPFRCSQELVSLFGSGMLDHNIWRKLRLVILLLLANLRHDPIHVMLITDGHNPLLIRFLNMLMALGSTEMKNWNPHFYPRLEPRKIIFHQNSTKNQFMMIPIDLDLIPKRQLDMSKWSHPQFQKITHDTLHFDWHCSLLGITEYSLPEDSRFKKSIKLHQENVIHFDLALNLKSQNGNQTIDEIQSYSVLLHDPILENQNLFQSWFRTISEMPDPDFPAKLQELISAYITNLRTHCDIPYSIDKLVSILSKLSIAHARLTHSHEVRDEDCVVAINLVEESMALVHDTSLFGFSSYDQDLENIQLGENEDVVGNAVESLEELMASVKELCGQGR